MRVLVAPDKFMGSLTAAEVAEATARGLRSRGLDVETAFHQPRVDVSGVGPIRVNRLLPDGVKKAIAAKLPIVEVDNPVSPLGFANPSCIVRDPRTGELTGMNEVMSPWAGGAAQ